MSEAYGTWQRVNADKAQGIKFAKLGGHGWDKFREFWEIFDMFDGLFMCPNFVVSEDSLNAVVWYKKLWGVFRMSLAFCASSTRK